MKGYLTQTLGEWMVKHDSNGDIKLYPLCPETQKWSKKNETKKFLKEGIEVVVGQRSGQGNRRND